MKKFTRILVCIMLFVFAFSFVACGNKEKDSFVYPTANMATKGNGGMAVQKGNYIYFVNGFKSISSTDINKKMKYNLGSLVVTKLDNNGNPVTDDGGIKDDYYRTMTDKLAGYEVTDLHIFGDYLYFVSPCLENEMVEGKEVWAKDKVVFYRMKLNKSGKVEELYQSKENYSDFDYAYYASNNKVCILIYEKENSKLVRIECGKGTNVVATNISSLVMPDDGLNNNNKIFYIKNSMLYRYDAINNVSTEYKSVSETAQVKFIAGDYVFITETHSVGNSKNTDLYVSSISNVSKFNFVCASSNYKDVRVSKNGNIVVCINDKMIEAYVTDTEKEIVPIELLSEEKDINLIGFNESDLFYYLAGDENITIKSISVNNLLAGSETQVQEVATITGANTTYFDIDNDYMYFYATAGENSNLYLYRIVLNNPDSSQLAQMIGIL